MTHLLSWIMPRPRLEERCGEGFPLLLTCALQFYPRVSVGEQVSCSSLGGWESEALGEPRSLLPSSTDTPVPFKVMILRACVTSRALICCWPAVSVLTGPQSSQNNVSTLRKESRGVPKKAAQIFLVFLGCIWFLCCESQPNHLPSWISALRVWEVLFIATLLPHLFLNLLDKNNRCHFKK